MASVLQYAATNKIPKIGEIDKRHEVINKTEKNELIYKFNNVLTNFIHIFMHLGSLWYLVSSLKWITQFFRSVCKSPSFPPFGNVCSVQLMYLTNRKYNTEQNLPNSAAVGPMTENQSIGPTREEEIFVHFDFKLAQMQKELQT